MVIRKSYERCYSTRSAVSLQFGLVATGKPESLIPPQILRQIIYTTAEKSKLTPGQHLKSVLRAEIEGEAPKDLQNWYSQIYGEFSKAGLSEVMRDVLPPASFQVARCVVINNTLFWKRRRATAV
jgi:hypothetical protein